MLRCHYLWYLCAVMWPSYPKANKRLLGQKKERISSISSDEGAQMNPSVGREVTIRDEVLMRINAPKLFVMLPLSREGSWELSIARVGTTTTTFRRLVMFQQCSSCVLSPWLLSNTSCMLGCLEEGQTHLDDGKTRSVQPMQTDVTCWAWSQSLICRVVLIQTYFVGLGSGFLFGLGLD